MTHHLAVLHRKEIVSIALFAVVDELLAFLRVSVEIVPLNHVRTHAGRYVVLARITV